MSINRYLHLCVLSLPFTVLLSAASYAQDTVNQALLAKITEAQQSLANTEKRVADERSQMAKSSTP